ncbi:unnamed protein product [Sympodiomycopsis kandeliae]
MVMGLSGFNLYKYVSKSPAIMKYFVPVSERYAQACGYRQIGLKYDDLIPEETHTVQKALSRLSERESYDRAYRFRRAIQQSILHRDLPKDQWTKPEEDVPYLRPLIEEIEQEERERREWDTISIKKLKGGH